MNTSGVLIVNLNSNQDSYAQCLDVIGLIEQFQNTDDRTALYKIIMNKMMECSSSQNEHIRIHFSLKNLLRNGSKRYFEEPLLNHEGKKFVVMQSISSKERQKKFIQYACEGKISYHLRIHFDNDRDASILNLHYFAMLLNNCKKIFNLSSDQDLASKLSAFLVPTSGEEYPYNSKTENIDYDLYKRASNYLRLVTKFNNGVVYGVVNESGHPTVQALDFASFLRKDTAFPLLYIEQNHSVMPVNYLDKSRENRKYLKTERDSIDNYDLVFNKKNMPDDNTVKKALQYHSDTVKPFNFANDEDPQVSLADFILNSARERLLLEFAEAGSETVIDDSNRKEILECGHRYIEEFIDDILSVCQNGDRFTCTIFSFLFDLKNIHISNKKQVVNKIRSIGKLADELSAGIKQIVQNSLQHSESHNCFITLYKDSSKKVVAIISDLNNKSTITENFIDRLEHEKAELCKEQKPSETMQNGYHILLKNKGKIKIKNLFSFFDNNEDKNLWFYFRQADISAHIGLTVFSQIAKRCNAELKVISNKTFCLNADNTFFYDYFGEQQLSISKYNTYVIPGTQVSITIPIQAIESEQINNGLIQLCTGRNTCENYAAYAEYIDYKCTSLFSFLEDDSKAFTEKEKLSKMLTITKTCHIANASEKFRLQIKWAEYFTKLLKKANPEQLNIISAKETLDFYEILKNDDYCEIIVKSIFTAFAGLASREKLFFALTNFTDAFVRIFKSLSSSTLALMRFPKNIQLFISNDDDEINQPLQHKNKQQIIFLGSSIGVAVQNAYILSMEQSAQSFSANEYVSAINFLNIFETQVSADVNSNDIGNYLVMPFSSLINENKLPDYFNQIKNLSELPMVGANSLQKGYKFANTHMRLGNKVHTEEFYEMSFLFYRTTVSNRAAFHILKELINEDVLDEILKNKNNIIFYGYASYSQAILMSLVEMLKLYLCDKKGLDEYNNKIFYASYQYNLQTTSNFANIHVYRNKLGSIDNSVVIQIVPISSTLTTFDKMWAEYMLTFKDETPKLVANYTVYLVRHQCRENTKDISLDCSKRSLIEEKYWKTIDISNRYIDLEENKFDNIKDCMRIHFIMVGGSHWHLPLECTLCYPKSVYFEMPLVETDPTSTVPSQQIHLYNNTNMCNAENTERIKALFGCVYYGHFARSKNHFQYYINTQKYFAKSEEKIKNWLDEIKREENPEKDNLKPILNIIFSPEHNTNVGFSQYVNAYYFNGTAEIVSVNEDKQFRSNFICENDSIRKTIEKLFHDFPEIDKPVRFFFVDDNIVSGETYRKASSLLQSLLPHELKAVYGTNVFDKCFFLIDRLSYSTKEAYTITPSTNFLSYCKINISNMRTHGDSCIGCKIEREAIRLFRRSSIKDTANYWAKKSFDYKAVPFDSNELQNYNDFESYARLVLSHIIQREIVTISDMESGEFFDWCLSMLHYFLDKEQDYNHNIDIITRDYIEDIINCHSSNSTCQSVNIYLVETFVKLLSRPFYTFNYNIKTQIMRLIIALCENFLEDNNGDGKILPSPKSDCTEHKKAEAFYSFGKRWTYLYSFSSKLKNELIKIGNTEYLLFMQECLLEALSDMKCTYLLRKDTIRKIQRYLYKLNSSASLQQCPKCNVSGENSKCRKRLKSTTCSGDLITCFWRQYAINLYKLIDTNSDETRSLWIEYLLITGQEYESVKNSNYPCNKNALYESIISDNKTGEDIAFKNFCNQIFLQNTRILFDGIEKMSRLDALSEKNNTDVKEQNQRDNSDMANPYFMDNYIENRKIDEQWRHNGIGRTNEIITSGEKLLFKVLQFNSSQSEALNDSIVDRRYFKLLSAIKEMIAQKYSTICKQNINIALLTKNEESSEKNCVFDIIRTDFGNQYNKIVRESDINKWAKMKSIIKERVAEALHHNGNILKKSDLDVADSKNVLTEGDLNELGYYIEYTNSNENSNYLTDQCSSFYTDGNSYHKPYFILHFENDKCDTNYKLGRKIKPIVDVYIYVSLIIEDPHERTTLPWLIMRDILTYRNRLLEYFEEDFNNNIVQRSYRSFQEKNILEHEKAASHSSTVDDSDSMKIFKAKRDGDCNVSDEQLLLLKSYTNITISKLFNRSFHTSNNFEYALQAPPQDVPELYIKDEQQEGDDNDLKRRLLSFSDMDLPGVSDNRFFWLKSILDIQVTNLENAFFISSVSNDSEGGHRFYNLEYMKCLIMDILLSAIKSKTSTPNFLEKVEELREFGKKCDGKYSPTSRPSKVVYFARTKSDNDWEPDYLTILNSVERRTDLKAGMLRIKNQEIQYHLNNAIDYPGGHMSLLTIKRYIEGLNKKMLAGKTTFEFCKIESLKAKYGFIQEKDEFWFKTDLPILEKE